MESERFPGFEKLLERGQYAVYEEEENYLTPVIGGGMLVLVPLYLLLFHFTSESIIAVLLRFGVLCGFTIVTYGLFIRKRALEKYRFRGLSRRTISAAIEYLDAATVPVEQIESPAPYHDGTIHTEYDLHKRFEDYLRLMKCLHLMIFWPQEQVKEAEEHLADYRKAIGMMVLVGSLIGFILVLLGLSLALAFRNSGIIYEMIISTIVVSLLGSGIYAIGWILLKGYRTIDLCDMKWLNDIPVSDNISLSDTLNEILLLLVDQYEHPLRFFVAGQYEVMTYTGRTKTAFTLARLKEAVLYPS